MPADPTRRCPHCDAHLRDWATHCWKCEQPIEGDPVAADPSVIQPQATGEADSPSPDPPSPDAPSASTPFWQFSVWELLLVMTIVSLVCAAWVLAPGLGMMATLVVAPVAMRTYLVLRTRQQRGLATSTQDRIYMIFSSVGVCIAVILLLQAAIAIGLIASCFGLLFSGGLSGSINESAAMALWAAGPILGVGTVAFFAVRWIRNRWRDDTRK